MSLKINSGKGSSPKAAPTPPSRASYVLGSRPGQLRANPVPRIKPVDGQTMYGKGANPANPAGASFGNTGQTG